MKIRMEVHLRFVVVMPGTRVRLRRPEHRPIAPGIHDFLFCFQDVDGRDKPGHDGL
jgi:hypothetical protein